MARLRGQARTAPLVTLVVAFLIVNTLGWVFFAPRIALANRERDPISLEAALPTQMVHEADRLVVVMDAPLSTRPSDELVGGPLADAPFTIVPAIGGRWEWETASRIAFVLDAPIPQAHSIEMTPTPALETLAGRPVAGACRPSWTTAPLDVQHAVLHTLDPTHATIEIAFNAPVDAKALAQHLTVRPEGRSRPQAELLDVDFLTREVEATHYVRVLRAGSSGSTALRVAVSRGLAPAVGQLPLASEETFTVDPPASFSLVRGRASSPTDSTSSVVTLSFDRPLAARQETPSVTVSPAVEPLHTRVRGQAIVLEGPFECGERYTVEVGESLLSDADEPLGRTARLQVDIPHREARLWMPAADGILSPNGGLTVEVHTTNVSALRVSAYEVLPGNLVPHVRGERPRHTSRQVRSDVFPLERRPDEPQRHVLDLRTLFADTPGGVRGVYAIEVTSTENRWTRDHSLVRITDLAPTVKRDAEGDHVWLRSITTGEVVADAAVSALSITDQVLASARTDTDGYAFLPIRADHPDGRPFVVVAEKDGDVGYLTSHGHSWSIPREVSRGRTRPRGADVFVYPERSIYRPGDTVHVTGIARDPNGRVHTGSLRVAIERPDGQRAIEDTASPEVEQGVFHLDVATSVDARTGLWKILVIDPDTGEVVGRARFGVEAFLPARIVARASLASGDDVPGPMIEPASAAGPLLTRAVAESTAAGSTVTGAPVPPPGPAVRIDARALAGTSVHGFTASLEARWTPQTYASERFTDFTFRRLEDERRAFGAAIAVPIEEDGHAVAFVPGAERLAPGLWSAHATWTVTEPGSRSVTAAVDVPHDTAAMHLGLSVPGAPVGASMRAVESGVPFDVRVLAVTADDEPIDPGKLWLVLERIERSRVLERVGGRMAWRTREDSTTQWDGPVLAPNGAGMQSLMCSLPGHYRVTLCADREVVRTAQEFYATAGDPTAFEPPRDEETRVDVVLSPSPIMAGTAAEVLIRAPFDGALLLTLEDERLRWHTQATLVHGEARVQVPVPADLRGGALLSAQVTRPVDRGAVSWRPHRAHGWARVAIDRDSARLPVTIEAPARVRPGATAQVTVRVDAEVDPLRPPVVHLWAVDEGIRLAGGHRRPAPHAHFFADTAHGTPTSDAWFDLLPDLELPPEVGRIGGDEGALGSARRRPPERVHRVPGVVWRHAVALGADGTLDASVRVPDFTGELRWMAVVADGDRYGDAGASTRLAGEVPLEVSFPRFAAPGDRFRVPVRYENQTNQTATITPRISIEGPGRVLTDELVEASFADEQPAQDTLEPGERAIQWIEIAATGTGRISGRVWLEGAFADGRAVEERALFDLPVRTGRPRVIMSQVASVDASVGVLELDLAASLGLEEADLSAPCRIEVSRSLGVTLLPAGRYVTDYPHGCAEQTSSKIWALLALPGLAAPTDDPVHVRQVVSARVEAGISRLWSMQLSNGSIGYWPRAQNGSQWATTYVAELLAACGTAGFDVPEPLVERLADRLENRLTAVAPPRDRALLVRALTALGRPQPGWVRRLEEQPDRLGAAGRAALANVLAREGERTRAIALLEMSAQEPTAREEDGFARLASGTRTLARTLETYLMAAPDSPRVAELVLALEAERRNGRWSNTVDNASALVALAAYRDIMEREPAEWTGRVTGGGLALEVSSNAETTADLSDASTPLRVELEGTGRAFVTVTAAATTPADAEPRHSGLIVRRRWVDAEGVEVDVDTIRVGDLVFVELALETSGRRRINDVALVDALPAGFEIETPRLLTKRPADWADAAPLGKADRTEFLDDRALIFASATDRPRAFVYTMRAVAAGTFEVPPAQAEAMYAPETCSIGSRTTTVRIAE